MLNNFHLIFISCLVSAALALSTSAQVATPPTKPVLTPEEITCKKNYECMGIPTGCCGEEWQAANRANVLNIKHRIRTYCKSLKQTNPQLCKGKKELLFSPKTVCKEQKCTIAQ